MTLCRLCGYVLFICDIFQNNLTSLKRNVYTLVNIYIIAAAKVGSS